MRAARSLAAIAELMPTTGFLAKDAAIMVQSTFIQSFHHLS